MAEKEDHSSVHIHANLDLKKFIIGVEIGFPFPETTISLRREILVSEKESFVECEEEGNGRWKSANKRDFPILFVSKVNDVQ